MVLVTPQLLENFDDQSEQKTTTLSDFKQSRDSFGVLLCKDRTKPQDQNCTDSRNEFSNDNIAPQTNIMANSEFNLDTLEMVTLFENLEPGMYMLDVFKSTDYYFDSALADTSTSANLNSFVKKLNTVAPTTATESPLDTYLKDETITKKLKSHYKGLKKPYPMKNCKNSNYKPLSENNVMQTPNVTACEFLNSFSNTLPDEGTSLTWLLNFQVSSIWHSINYNNDIAEKMKKKPENLQKKPRFTYTELIEQALKESGKLTVSEIYNWISSHYPYYQQQDDRWKNSVRHNLSINPQFQKGKKASQGAGHLWNISKTVSQNSVLNNHRNTNSSIEGNTLSLPCVNIESNSRNKDVVKLTQDSVNNLITQLDEEVLTATKNIQEDRNMNFSDINLDDTAIYLHSASTLHYSENDTMRSQDLKNGDTDHRFSSFSPIIRGITEEYSTTEERNFLTDDIHNCICSGDNTFLSDELNSTYDEWFSKISLVNL